MPADLKRHAKEVPETLETEFVLNTAEEGTSINICLLYDGGGGGPKVELNPKPKKILNFGDFGTLKNTCRNIWYRKNIQCFPSVTVRIYMNFIKLEKKEHIT